MPPKTTKRITARERADEIVMSELVLGRSALVGAQIDLLGKWIKEAIEAHAIAARARRRSKNRSKLRAMARRLDELMQGKRKGK